MVVLSVLASIFFLLAVKRRQRFANLSIAMLCVVLVFAPALSSHNDSLIATFLPVGQGDSSVIEIPSGEVMVVDGGGNHDDSYNPGDRII
jgi:competence protein ComEC